MVIDTEDTPLMTTSDVSRLLHVHINTIRRWSNKGILKSYHVGNRGDRRFKREDIERFLCDSRLLSYKARDAALLSTNPKMIMRKRRSLS